MKRLIRNLLVAVAALVATTLVVGSVTEMVLRAKARREFPAPGRLVDIGGRSIQIDCRGAGSPTIVLESGLDLLGSLSWSAVHDSLAATTRTCAYSRAGIMWSDASKVAFSSSAVAADLRAVLTAAGESTPFVLVGHSIGGLYVLKYRELYAGDVAAVVLVDASHPGQVARMEAASGASMAMPLGMLSLAVKLAPIGILRMVAPSPAPPHATGVATRAPASFLPMSLPALVNETRQVQATFAAGRSSQSLGDLPLSVLTAGAPKSAEELQQMRITEEQGQRLQAEWVKLQDEEAGWSTKSRHEIVKDATHAIQFDRPDVVIRVVRETVARTRVAP